jgi:peptidyl-prolyl cis-trans isomerase D
MLDSLRKAAGTWVAKLLLMLLVASFAVWGVSGQITGGLGNSVVSVGDTKVSVNEYRLAYDRQVNVLSQRFGQRLTREQIVALGIDDQVLAQMISGALLDEQGRQMGLGLSKDRIAALTAQDPAFQGTDGQFSRQMFDYVLNQVGMRPEDYFANRTQVAMRQQIVDSVADGAKVPDVFLDALSRYRGEDRTAEYVVLPRSLVEPVAAPADAALSSWFEEKKAQYAAPEYRKIAYVKLEPEDIADESVVTDDQVRAEYERSRDRYTTVETRAMEQLVFPDRAAAEAARAAIDGGQTFEEAVTAAGRTMADVQIGTLSRAEMHDPAVADAAFSLAAGAVSPVVDGAFGPVLVRVTAVNPETVRSFEDVSAEIRKDLALAEANRILLDVHDSFEDSRAAGETLIEAAEKQRLEVTVVDAVDRSGQAPDGSRIDLPVANQLLTGAFEAEVGIENPPVAIGSNGYVYYEVEGITQARERTLDEVRERVVADWTAAEADRLLAERAAALQERLKGGASLDEIAAELSLEKLTKRGLKREANDGDFGQDGVNAVFAVAQDGTGVFAAPSGGSRILFKVTEVIEPAAAGADAVAPEERDRYSSGLSDDLLDQLVARLQTQYSVEVNRAAVQQALSF